MDELEKSLRSVLSHPKVERNKNISPYFTLRTQTIAELYTEARTKDDLIQIIKIAHQYQVPLLVLGGGSNIAVTKDIIKGIVARNFYFKKEIVADTPEYTDMLFSSGYPIARVVSETVQAGLAGFEYHLGLPGTIGGALYMNSKWTKPVSYCGDSLLYAELITPAGEIRREERDYFQFAYDYSILQKTKETVLEGVFRLVKKDPALLKKISEEAHDYRKKTQPFGVATSGCFFQNISPTDTHGDPETSAGYYIDHAGLKNTQIGDFIVSDKHANFIINRGQGKPEDLLKLVSAIKEKVHTTYGVTLKEEVIVL